MKDVAVAPVPSCNTSDAHDVERSSLLDLSALVLAIHPCYASSRLE